MDTTEKRRRWTVRRRLEDWKIQDIATALRTNEKTVDRWCSVYREYGERGYKLNSTNSTRSTEPRKNQ